MDFCDFNHVDPKKWLIFAIFGPIWTKFRSKQLKIWPGIHFCSRFDRIDSIGSIRLQKWFVSQTANDVLSILSSQHRPQMMYYQYIVPNTDRKWCIINTQFPIHFTNLNMMLPFTNNFFTMISCLQCYRVRFTLIWCSQLLPLHYSLVFSFICLTVIFCNANEYFLML